MECAIGRNWAGECRRIADEIRKRVLAHSIIHGGYLSQACSSAEIFGALYGHAMNLGPRGVPPSRRPTRDGARTRPSACRA